MAIRILHVVKTSHGARWAAMQAGVLSQLGFDIHVLLPSNKGEAVAYWQTAGATMHLVDASLPLAKPHAIPDRVRHIRQLVACIRPDVIHSHFVTTTMMLRLALRGRYTIPRIFQVPGPLHLEHTLYRYAEISSAGDDDRWIASSRYTARLYARHGVASDKLFLSYYGSELTEPSNPTENTLRTNYRIPPGTKLVGNVNYMYPPKYYLGQRHGLKRHEDVIDALGLAIKQRHNIVGVLVGGQWGNGRGYEARLRHRARARAGDRILFTGRVAPQEAMALWPDFDCAVHVPETENCGGVVEPLALQVPTIASDVGGLPEVVVDGLTGWTVPVGMPHRLAECIHSVLSDPETAGNRARLGQRLVRHMFDVNRTGREVAQIYEYVIGLSSEKPPYFDARSYLEQAPT
jgi:glycosyltransferase involved in cell wall biosynthesis